MQGISYGVYQKGNLYRVCRSSGILRPGGRLSLVPRLAEIVVVQLPEAEEEPALSGVAGRA